MPKHLTVKQFPTKHTAFTTGGLRSLIFNENTNGLAESGAIIRIGRKVLIDETKFFSWVESQNGFTTLVNAGVKFDLRETASIQHYPQEYLDWCLANGRPNPRLADAGNVVRVKGGK